MEHVEPVLDPGATVRDDLELLAVDSFLLGPVERAVVGRDRRQGVRLEGLPQELLVLLWPWRRRVDVLAALEARLVERRSEERRVGEEGRCLESRCATKNNT